MKIELVKQIVDRIYYAKEVVFKGNPEILEVKLLFYSTARGVVLTKGRGFATTPRLLPPLVESTLILFL